MKPGLRLHSMEEAETKKCSPLIRPGITTVVPPQRRSIKRPTTVVVPWLDLDGKKG
jgi:hypothetical protein